MVFKPETVGFDRLLPANDSQKTGVLKFASVRWKIPPSEPTRKSPSESNALEWKSTCGPVPDTLRIDVNVGVGASALFENRIVVWPAATTTLGLNGLTATTLSYDPWSPR